MITNNSILKWIVILPLIFVILFSCKKDKNNYTTAPVMSYPKINTETYVYGGNSSTETYSYNSNGRIFLLTQSDGSFIKYEYSNNKLIMEHYQSGGSLLYTAFNKINSLGLVVSDSMSSSYSKYEYDVNGYLIKELNYNNGILTDSSIYTIFNGNTISVTRNNLTTTYLYTVEYFTDKSNTIGNENKGIGFWGKQSTNLVKSVAYSIVGQGQLSLEEYTYEFDINGRVSRQTITGDPGYTTFTYND